MKKVLLAFLLVSLAGSLAHGEGIKFGVGAFGGLNIPAVQDDQASGSTFGFMARVKVLKFVVVEPNMTFGKWGKPGTINGVDLGIDGSKINSFGIDATIGGVPGVPGFKPYGVLGFASYKVKNDDTGYDESNLGWSAGFGFGFGVSPNFDVDVRGKFVVAPQEAGSKKAITVTAGLVYNFGSTY